MNLTKLEHSILASFILAVLLGGCSFPKPHPQAPTSTAPSQSTATLTPGPFPTSTSSPSPTPTPVQVILTPAANPPQAGRIEDAPTGVSSPASVTVIYDPQPLLWSNAWCAKDKDTLIRNLAVIEWRFNLDGQPVPLEQFTPSSDEDQTTHQTCQRYALLLTAWPPGRHTLQKTLTLRQSLNDGVREFPAGEQTRTETVLVADPSVPPPADPQAWLSVVQETFAPPALPWQTGPLADEWFSGTAEIKDGKYLLDMQEVHQNTVFRLPPAVKVLSGPFQVSVTAERLGGTPTGACYGLYFHYNYADGNFYQWTVCDGGTFSVEIFYNGAWDTLVPWTSAQAIKTGSGNRLTARIEGSHMTFVINDMRVAELDDERLYGGYTGILAQAGRNAPARFAFSDFLVQVR